MDNGRFDNGRWTIDTQVKPRGLAKLREIIEVEVVSGDWYFATRDSFSQLNFFEKL